MLISVSLDLIPEVKEVGTELRDLENFVAKYGLKFSRRTSKKDHFVVRNTNGKIEGSLVRVRGLWTFYRSMTGTELNVLNEGLQRNDHNFTL